MKSSTANPFNITKAVDFSDQQINDYWIDIPGGGFEKLAKPISPMPMLILGGKGSGKTHLMRYFSYSVQKVRHSPDILSGIQSDKYIGIYLRCGGLNAGRFKGKGQTEEAWADVFSYHMDLWLSQLVIRTVLDAFAETEELEATEGLICRDICTLFDTAADSVPATMSTLNAYFRDLQKQVDTSVNNCAISRRLDVHIRAARGKLVFGVPRYLTERLHSLVGCLFVYLIDEFENLSEQQQKYVNTLLREKEGPCSFKVGARLYGMRTYGTLSADEENKEGSEFETLRLDARLRDNKQYRLFAKKLVVRRLSEHGYLTGDGAAQKAMVKSLATYFEDLSGAPFARDETEFIVMKYKGRMRPYLQALRSKLAEGISAGTAPGVRTDRDIQRIHDLMAYDQYPLLEKVNIFLLYQAWYAGKNLIESAEAIAAACRDYVNDPTEDKAYQKPMYHFKTDMLAQLFRECDQKQRYTGIETFIAMSDGLPRNLLVLLKTIFSWATFNGEEPFVDEKHPASIKSQQTGATEASEWFFSDAQTMGIDGKLVLDGINRLGTLFRGIRFANKPVECSCTSFSCDQAGLTSESRRLLDVAQQWSLIIKVGERQSNSQRLDLHLQLNPMLAPRWDLGISRRGVLSLPPEEVNAIFDPEWAKEFRRFLLARIGRMTAPNFGARPNDPSQGSLWSELGDV